MKTNPQSNPRIRFGAAGILFLSSIAILLSSCEKPPSSREKESGEKDTRIGVKMLTPSDPEIESIRLKLDEIYAEIQKKKGQLAVSELPADAPEHRRLVADINRLEKEKIRYESTIEVGAPGSQDLDSPSKKAPAESIRLPVDRILRNNEGRELDVSIVGRSATHLTIVRRSDSSRFDIPISSLSVDDQVFARSLAILAAPVVREEPEIPSYVASRLKQIKRLEEKLTRLDIDLRSSKNSILIRNYEDQKKRIRIEIEELEGDIDRYELNNAER